jgi:ribose 5-phosphate isomerase A
MSATDRLAQEATAPIRSGMTVGLGTGRAASRAVRALAARVGAESLRVTCVSTSDATTELARSLGLTVVEFSGVDRVDYLFDGADEVDGALRMIKGRGGAMTREKMVARASAHRVYLIDEAKVVGRLGEKAPLPIEVMEFGFASVRAALEREGLKGPRRTREDGSVYRTDNGCAVIDAPLAPGADAGRIDALLGATPGVVGHGLFLIEADVVLIEDQAGAVRRLAR